tara:strand:+ start:2535 stop:4049 length:1515 start_codon:yes stop_codon:yes gene_type:complete
MFSMEKKLDILLIIPSGRAKVYQKLGNDLSAIEPPVWATLLATFLLNRGCSVEILDAESEYLSHDEAAMRIAEIKPLLAVFMIYGQQPSASTQSMPAGRELCQLVDESGLGVKTVCLGTHPSALPERTLREEPYDFVCEGEGPVTVYELFQVLKEGTEEYGKVPGLWYRQGGEVGVGPKAELIQDLDCELGGQKWELLDMSRYRAHNWHCFDNVSDRKPYASIQTSLGCPYKCSFCCINAPFGGPGIRFWSPQLIVDQIDVLVEKYSIRNIKIPDEMFVLNEQHVIGICDLLIDRNYDLNIWAYGRIDTVKDRFLEKLKKAGFNWLGIGIESGSKYVRNGVSKGKFGDADIVAVIEKIRGHGISVGANYIFGLPDDTMESMTNTLDLAVYLNTEWANFYCAMAYPGSPLYHMAKEKKIPLPGDDGGPGWIGYSQHSYDTLPLATEHLSATEVIDFRDQAFNKYFKNNDYLKMLGGKFGSQAVDHINEMTSIDIQRKHRSASEVT